MEQVASGTWEATPRLSKLLIRTFCDIAIKNGIATHYEARDTYSFTNIVGKMSDRASTVTKLTKFLVEEKAGHLKAKGIAEEESEK